MDTTIIGYTNCFAWFIMTPRDSIDVTKRFFSALDWLVTQKVIRGRSTFCNRYGIDRRNFSLVERKPESNSLKVAWLVYLTRDYRISAKWLLTGEGRIKRKTRTVNNSSAQGEQK